MYVDPLQFVLSLLGIYFLGGAVEERIGPARFYGVFFGSLVLSAIAGFALSLSGVIAQGPAMGSGAAANAILMVFYLFNRGAPIMLFPIPIQIPVKCSDRDRIPTAQSLRSFLFHTAARPRCRIYMVFAVLNAQDVTSHLRTVLWAPQFLLSLEAPSCRPQIRSLHARPRPHGHLRRARQLHSTR